LLAGEEPHQKLRSEDYKPPTAALLENYQSDSSVEADEDSDNEGGSDVANRTEAPSATKPRRRTRAATAEQPTSRAVAKAEAAKTAKLEVDKKKRKRRANPLLAVQMITPTPLTKEVEDDEDQATDDPLIVEDRMTRRSLNPAAKGQRDIEQKTNEDEGGPTGYRWCASKDACAGKSTTL
jgi:hypothetical protein